MKAVVLPVEKNQPKRHFITLKRKKLLNELLVNSRNITYHNAVELYWYLRSFHNPIKARKKNGNVVSITKLHTDGLHINRERLAKDLSCTKCTISRNLALLESHGLIARDYTKKAISVNHLVIYVLKDTPHFYNEYGVSENRISELKPYTNSAYNEANFGTKFNPQNIGVSAITVIVPCYHGDSTDNLEEELLLPNNNYSSLYDSTQSKKNNIRLVETNFSNPPLKKSPREDDFYANSEQEERSTYCDDTAGDDMPDYATAEFGLPSTLTEKTNNHIQSADPQPAPIAALEDRTNKMVSMQDLMQLIPEPIIETQEEQLMALPEKKQDLRQHLNYEIHRTFPKNTSESLQDSLVITPIGPNKIGVKFNKKIPLKTDDKEYLRQCIKVVYGNSIVMVAINATPEIEEVAKPKMPSAEDTENRGNHQQVVVSPAEFKWQSIKAYVLASIYDNAREHIKYALGQTNILSLEGKKLKLSAKYSACQKLNDHQSLIESAAKHHDVDIEITNIDDNDTLYFPWVFDSATLPPLILETKDNEKI